MKKYKYTGETMTWSGYELHRIVALRDFGDVKKGDIGGWIENGNNLSHEGNCWVYDNSRVFDDAEVGDNAQIKGCSVVWNSAHVFDNAVVDSSHVRAHAWIFENAQVANASLIDNDAMVYGNTKIDNKIIYSGHHVY